MAKKNNTNMYLLELQQSVCVQSSRWRQYLPYICLSIYLTLLKMRNETVFGLFFPTLYKFCRTTYFCSQSDRPANIRKLRKKKQIAPSKAPELTSTMQNRSETIEIKSKTKCLKTNSSGISKWQTLLCSEVVDVKSSC